MEGIYIYLYIYLYISLWTLIFLGIRQIRRLASRVMRISPNEIDVPPLLSLCLVPQLLSHLSYIYMCVYMIVMCLVGGVCRHHQGTTGKKQYAHVILCQIHVHNVCICIYMCVYICVCLHVNYMLIVSWCLHVITFKVHVVRVSYMFTCNVRVYYMIALSCVPNN
jgi:hypothetical protein